jgi:L-asparaginase II
MQSFKLEVEVTRGATVESRHRVAVAVVRDGEGVIAAADDWRLTTMWRSCAKPFQAMPLVAGGGFDRLGWGSEELALACASHGGEPEHVAVAQRRLDSIGLPADALACGADTPLSARGAAVLRESGAPATRLHHNCSGKHSAMLARTVLEGWNPDGYHLAAHPVQRDVRAAVLEWTGMRAEALAEGVDGCGVVVFGLGLDAMAHAFARFAAEAARDGTPSARIAGAIRLHPHLYGGTGRLDTLLVEEAAGRILPKVGAEGVYCVAVPSERLGIALKVLDGAARALLPAVIAVLQRFGALADTDELSARLRGFAARDVRNSRGETVGSIRAVLT